MIFFQDVGKYSMVDMSYKICEVISLELLYAYFFHSAQTVMCAEDVLRLHGAQ